MSEIERIVREAKGDAHAAIEELREGNDAAAEHLMEQVYLRLLQASKIAREEAAA